MMAGDLALNSDVVLEGVVGQVDVDHLPGTQSSLFNDRALVEIWDDTRFTHHVGSSVLGTRVSGGSESVSVQGGTYGLSVRVDQKGGTVPGLQKTSVELVKVRDFWIILQIRVFHVSGRDHRHQCARSGVARLAHQLENTVEVGRIGPFQADNRLQERRDVLSVAHGDNVLGRLHIDKVAHFGGFRLFAGLHPVDVAKKRVDFSVMGYGSHGLGEWPLGGGVRREPTVVNHELRCVVRIFQIQKELRKNFGLDHALVYDGAGAEGGHIKSAIIVVPLQTLLFQLD
mmetsp:Transcript_25359/g.59363  ORF Transcript_25359/g.59363 Transcript_25359/m.59363 type:complete len:285 (+) Transcript_25359:3555-4409(+)